MRSFEAFDSRGYRTVGAREGYDRWASSYEDTVEDAMDLALLERLEVGWGGVGAVADLGCGTGRTGAWLAGRGVGEIDGVDLSPGMLEAARGRGVYRTLAEAEVADTGLDSDAYGLVVACLVDEHLGDLGPLYEEAARLAAPGAHLALVGFHPHFIIASGMPTHFDDAESGEPLAIETHVHLLSDHVAAGLGAGLELAVLPQDVPNAGDRGPVADRAVASGVVVVVEPVWQRLGPMVR